MARGEAARTAVPRESHAAFDPPADRPDPVALLQRTDKLLDGKAHDFYVRQLRDWKFSLDIDAMRPSAMLNYGQLCAWTLARSHAKSGDAVAIAAHLGNANVFDEAINRFASAYADQTECDHQALATAAATGRIIAHSGL